MKLTKLDLTRLRNFQRAKERAPTATTGLWRLKSLWLAIIALTMLGYWTAPSPSAAYFVVGLGAGGLLSACVIAFILPRFWPLTREILNWERIEQLIREHDGKGGYHAASPNRRPRFPFATLLGRDYPFSAPPASPAAVGEPRSLSHNALEPSRLAASPSADEGVQEYRGVGSPAWRAAAQSSAGWF